MIPRFLGAIAAASWLAGCVSILGVDVDDHEAVADVVCGCRDENVDRALCLTAVEAFQRDEATDARLVACIVETEAACGALDDCLLEEGLCSPRGGRCNAEPVDGRVNLRCCDGLSCGPSSRCGEEQPPPCMNLGAACGTCCEGLQCDGGKCCATEGTACSANRDCCGSSTCLAGVCQTCGAVTEQCEGGVTQTTCCDRLPCVGGFCAAGE